jgi:adenylyltransferase/sulfurtransferase
VVCGDHPTVTDLLDYEDFCGISASGKNVPPRTPAVTALRDYAVDMAEACRLMAERDVHIIDVRSASEYRAGHIPGALNYPLEALDELNALDSRLLVVCAAGVRSATAVQYLRSKGMVAWSLAGGMGAWFSAGNSVEGNAVSRPENG